MSLQQLRENSKMIGSIPLREFVRNPSSQFSHFSKTFEVTDNSGLVDIESFGQHSGCYAVIFLYGFQKCLIVEIRWSSSSWLIFQASVTRFEAGKPFLALSLTNCSISEKLVEITRGLRRLLSFFEVVEQNRTNVDIVFNTHPYEQYS